MKQTPLKDLVIKNPTKLSTILEAHKLDFCCGGNKTLEEACKEQKLNVDAIVEEINTALASNNKDFALDNLSIHELVDHIVSTHHKYLRDTIPPLQALMAKVHRVHGKNHAELAELNAVVTVLTSELLTHLDKEEEDFENMKQGKINDLEREHEHHGENMAKIASLTNNFTPPKDACMAYKSLYGTLNELVADVHKHVHKENYVLFPMLLAKQQ